LNSEFGIRKVKNKAIALCTQQDNRFFDLGFFFEFEKGMAVAMR
jgi:hypothetical protein